MLLRMTAARKLEPSPKSDPIRRQGHRRRDEAQAELDRMRTEDDGADPIWSAMLAAPLAGADDLSDEERAQLECAEEDIRAGRVELVSQDEVHTALDRMRREQAG